MSKRWPRALAIALSGLAATSGGPARAADGDGAAIYHGKKGPGKGKRVVMVGGDEEYRSEEALPMLCRILAKHHGFTCTVLLAVNKQTGEIDAGTLDNIPGLEALDAADLMVVFLRWRKLPPEQMRHIDAYLRSGRPVIGLRTATHAFKNAAAGDPYVKWGSDSKLPGFEQGFGRQVLGETWIAHHGQHGSQSTRGVVAPGAEEHPILRGVRDVWGPTDVYRVRLPLPGDSQSLLLGQVLEGMKPADKAVSGGPNDPMMPVAWVKSFTNPDGGGKKARVFTTTMGAAQDLASEGLRRLFVNACYWALGLEAEIPARGTRVDFVGAYSPSPFKFGGHRRGIKPADLKADALAQGL